MLCFNNLSFTGLFKQSNSQSCNGFVRFKLLALMKNCCNNYWTNKENRKHYKDTKNCSWNTENNTTQSSILKFNIKRKKINPRAEEEMGVIAIISTATECDSACNNSASIQA